jgi:hypothetical protein
MNNELMESRSMDTYRFMDSSLDTLVKNLLGIKKEMYCSKCQSRKEISNHQLLPIDENDKIKLIAKCKNCHNQLSDYVDHSKFETTQKRFNKQDWHLVLQKGVYPYEWVDSYKKMFVSYLPDFKYWYSNLNGKEISISEYLFAKKVYKHFKFEKFIDYHNLYLKIDTVLLQDVWINFRRMCFKNYRLDPVYYISAPHLADSASLKITGQNLGLITEQKLYEIYEFGIRGGQSMIPHRYALANNYCYFYDEKLGKTVKPSKEAAERKGIYNSKKHLSYIMYLDCNNLYGKALSEPLPIGGFKYKNGNDFNIEKILKSKYDGKHGYTFIVDLEIPKELHKKFKDYPLLPEHYKPNLEELSFYQKELISMKIGKNPTDTKLISTLKPKENYTSIIDYRMLQECIKQGVILKKIKKVISFKQKAWLKPYIDLNTKLRQAATNEFVYGKQMENVRNRCQVSLFNKYEQFERCKEFESRDVIDKENVLVYKKKSKIKLNKPMYGGFVVLELSKLIMIEFYYNYLKPKFGKNIKLLMTDTDSFLVYIKTEDAYQDVKNDIEWFDTSDYKMDWMPQKNKKVPRLFKNELLGIPIREYAGLR